MRVYNKGRRTINPNTSHALRPGTWTEIPDKEAERLLKMFPRDLTAADQSASEAKLLTEIDTLKAQVSDLQAKLAHAEHALSVVDLASAADRTVVSEVTPESTKSLEADPVPPVTLEPAKPASKPTKSSKKK